jgi:hypothetical protein
VFRKLAGKLCPGEFAGSNAGGHLLQAGTLRRKF